MTLGTKDGGFTMSLKLTDSNFEALLLPFTEPTHYGMGKHGWVTSHFAARDKPPMPMLKAWVEECYRAVAPKTVVAKLDADELAPEPRRGTRRKTAKFSVRKKAAAKKKTTQPAQTARKVRRKATRKRP